MQRPVRPRQVTRTGERLAREDEGCRCARTEAIPRYRRGAQLPRGLRSEPRTPLQRSGVPRRPPMAGRRLIPSTPQNPQYQVEFPPSPSVQNQESYSDADYVTLPTAESMLPSQGPINYTVQVASRRAHTPPQQYSQEQRPVTPTYRVSSRTIIREYLTAPKQKQPQPAQELIPKEPEAHSDRKTRRSSDTEMDSRMLTYLIFCDEGRKTAEEIYRDVINTKNKTPTRIQLRGSKPPVWFPGYCHVLNSAGDVTVTASAREVMQKAWKAKP